MEISSLVIQLFSVLAAFMASTTAPASGEVVEVTDGDTLTVNSNGENHTVRLLGVDTPETMEANIDSDEFGNISDSCHLQKGAEATSFVRSQVLGEQVDLEYDPKSGQKGYYDRYLADVHYNGSAPGMVSLNKELLRLGHARFYENEEYVVYRETEYQTMESLAKSAEKGVWAGC